MPRNSCRQCDRGGLCTTLGFCVVSDQPARTDHTSLAYFDVVAKRCVNADEAGVADLNAAGYHDVGCFDTFDADDDMESDDLRPGPTSEEIRQPALNTHRSPI